MTYSVSHVLVLISLIAQAHATPVERLDCVVFHESSYRVEAVGAAGEVSLGQLMPETAREILTHALANPERSYLFEHIRGRPLDDPVLNLSLTAYGIERWPAKWTTMRLCVEPEG